MNRPHSCFTIFLYYCYVIPMENYDMFGEFTFGEIVRKQRRAMNLNQEELGKRLGLSKQTVSNWENNNVLPSVETLVKLARLFHCSTDYLLGLTENREGSLDITGLTPEQAASISNIVRDLRSAYGIKKDSSPDES